MKKALALSALAALESLAAGCRVGPRYRPPAALAPAVPGYQSALAENAANVADDGSIWKPAAPSDGMLRGKWWEVFGDPELNGYEEQLEVDNQTIRQQFQLFLAARDLIREARAQLFPSATIGPQFNRSLSSGNLRNASSLTGSGISNSNGNTTVVTNQGSQSTLWNGPLALTWQPDLWGRIRNTIRADEYSAQVSAADLELQRLTEESALAEAFFELRGEDALQKVVNDVVVADQDSLKLTQAQFETGIADRQALVQAQTTLQSAQAQAIAIAGPRATYEHAIAMLIGKPAPGFHVPVRPMTEAPPPIPVGIPSQLLERRPDVAAAERTMAAANAQIGVATAAYYPTLTLSATGGFESSSFTNWFKYPSRFWSAGPSFSQPVYDAGLRRSTVHQFIATYNADIAAYQQTVLVAFQQVEDYLAAVRIDSQEIARQKQATASAQEYLNLALDRYRTGLDPYLNVITAQNTLLVDQQTLYTTEIAVMTSTVQLVQALGGGWNVQDLPTPKDVYRAPGKADNQIER